MAEAEDIGNAKSSLSLPFLIRKCLTRNYTYPKWTNIRFPMRKGLVAISAPDNQLLVILPKKRMSSRCKLSCNTETNQQTNKQDPQMYPTFELQISNMYKGHRPTWPGGNQSLHQPMKIPVAVRCCRSAEASSPDPQRQAAQQVQFARGASASWHLARAKARDAAYKCHCWTPPGLANTATRKRERERATH